MVRYGISGVVNRKAKEEDSKPCVIVVKLLFVIFSAKLYLPL